MRLPRNILKAKLAAGDNCFGMWLHTGSPAVTEIVANAGLDFIIIDLEHGPGDLEVATAMMRATLGTETTPVVRVPSSDPAFLKRIVDAGAQSIIIPMVDTVEEAQGVVDACLYPPLGKRGDAVGIVRASKYGMVDDYLKTAHEQMLIIPQVESVQAVANAGEIAAISGVDAVFIGPDRKSVV